MSLRLNYFLIYIRGVLLTALLYTPLCTSLYLSLYTSLYASVYGFRSNSRSLADFPEGWHWYNTKPKEDKPKVNIKNHAKSKTSFNKLSASKQVEILHFYTMDSLKKATLYPSENNIINYLLWQKFWTEKASLFTQQWRRVLLTNPALDYSIKHPHENNAAKIEAKLLHNAQAVAVKKLAKTYGLLFFYQGKSLISKTLAPMLIQFAQDNHFAFLAISMDHKLLETLPSSSLDHGQASKLGVKFFPALILVNPYTKSVHPVNYGFITLDELNYRLLNIATNWKTRY